MTEPARIALDLAAVDPMTGDVHQTILEECWRPAFAGCLVPKYTGLQRDLEQYLTYYNTDRVHHGRWTKGRIPEEVIGKAKVWS